MIKKVKTMMKSLITSFAVMGMALSFIPTQIMAEEPTTEAGTAVVQETTTEDGTHEPGPDGLIASGTDEDGDVLWQIDENGILTISPANGESGDFSYYSDSSNIPDWVPWYEYRKDIKTIHTNGKITILDAAWLFYGCTNLTDISGLASWDITPVWYMTAVFEGCVNLTDISPLANWDMSNVSNLTALFSGCSSLSDLSPIKNWNLRRLSSTYETFRACTGLTDISPLANWDVSNLGTTNGMFQGCKNIKSLDALASWNVSGIYWMDSMFSGCSSITNLNAIKNWKTERLSSMTAAFENCENLVDISGLENWNVANVKNLSDVFSGCKNLQDISPLTNWNTSNVNLLGGMFKNCSSLTDISPLTNWNTSAVTDLTGFKRLGFQHGWYGSGDGMFAGCVSLSNIEPISGWDLSNNTNLSNMFNGCISLESNNALLNWSLEKTTNVEGMFNRCSNMKEADISNWKLNTGTITKNLFSGCTSLSSIKVADGTILSDMGIPSHEESGQYTENWAYGDPYNHTEIKSHQDFISQPLTGGTWYWEKKDPSVVASVTVKDNHGNYVCGTTVTVTDAEGNKVFESTTGSETLALPETLVLNDKYTVAVTAPYGYENPEAQEITIEGTADNPQTIDFVVPLKQLTITINAVDDEGNSIDGGEVAVYRYSDNAVATDINGQPAQASITKDGQTMFILEYDSNGYYVKQISAAEGYEIDSNTYEINKDLEDQLVTFTNNLIKQEEPEPTEEPDQEPEETPVTTPIPTEEPEKEENENPKTGVVSGFGGMIGTAGIAAVAGAMLYKARKKEKDSE